MNAVIIADVVVIVVVNNIICTYNIIIIIIIITCSDLQIDVTEVEGKDRNIEIQLSLYKTDSAYNCIRFNEIWNYKIDNSKPISEFGTLYSD